MGAESFHICDFRILRNGADGGHAYVAGRCTYNGQVVPVYVFMASKADEGLLASKASEPFTVIASRQNLSSALVCLYGNVVFRNTPNKGAAAAVRLHAERESGAAAAIRLQHGVVGAELTTTCRGRPPWTTRGGFGLRVLLAGRRMLQLSV